MVSGWFSSHVVNIFFILIAAWLVRRFGVKVITSLIEHTARGDFYPSKADRDKRIATLNTLGRAFVRIAVYILATLLIVGEINPAYTTALFASAGLIGVALGFGAQSLIRDFVSGIFIITENQYRIGDEVTLVGTSGVGEISGRVENLTIRTTILRDLDGNVHHVPNGNIGVTTNKTIGFSRLNEDIVVALDTDLDRLEHVINHVGEQIAADADLKQSIIEPPYVASIKGFEGDGIVVKVLAKTTAAAQWRVRSEFYRKLHTALKKNDIKLAGEKTK